MKPTQEQEDITDASVDLRAGENMKVLAFAGTGKTTTLKRVAKAKKQRGAYLVFASQNAEEAKRKLALTNCTATTMHALALSTVRSYIGSPVSHNARSVRECGIMNRFRIPRVEGWNEYRVASAVLRALSAFCSSDDQEFGVQHGVEAIVSSVGDPDFIRDRTAKELARNTIETLAGTVSQMAEAFWLKMAEDGAYSHDMYLKAIDLDPNLRGMTFSMFRYLMVDEAQDLNPVQRSIIMKTGLPLIAVGDPYQQIFSWRGAENSLAKILGQEFYLTQSFRFGENIAETAREILQLRPDGGPKQRLIGAGNGDISKFVGPKVAIVCRTNSGVIDQALEMIRKGKTIHVDNMDGLVRDVRSAQSLFEGRIREVQSKDLKHFSSWAELQIEAEEGDTNLSRLQTIVEDGLVHQIESLASNQVKDPNQADIALCTAHRSKGMEWPAVVLGNDWKDVRAMFGRYRKAKSQSEKHKTLALEEYNALYVAATRPMLRLKGHDRILHPVIQEASEDLGAGEWVRDYAADYEPTRGEIMSEVSAIKREAADDVDNRL